MSLILNEKDNIFAYVINDKSKNIGTVSYSEDEKDIEDKAIELEKDFKFVLSPQPVSENERMTLSVAGESGSGKSYFVREYAKRYNQMFPKNPI